MSLVAFRIGSEPFFTYSLLVILGLFAATALLAVEGRRRGWAGDQVLEVLVWALVPAIVGGRLVYMAAHWADYAAAPWQPFTPWGDGISFPGALSSGALGLAALAAWRRLPYTGLLGAVVPGLALGQAFGWLGAAAHGAWAGLALPAAIRWAPYMRDLYGIILPRFPLQYLAAGLSLVTFALTWGSPRSDSRRIALYALLTGWGLAALAWGQDARQPLVAGLSLEQLGYLAAGLAGLGIALAGKRRPALRPAT